MLEIRPARAGDVAALARLNAEIHAIHMAAVPDRYRQPTAAEVEEWFRAALADEAVAVLVAELDGAAAGYAVVRRVDAPGHIFAPPRRIAEVDQLGVAAAARRRGVGRALMAAAEQEGRAWGAAAVGLSVVGFNRDALRFYQALGYETWLTRLARAL
jgi:ribosomal protein S18 acetylase RimI-like enzyme